MTKLAVLDVETTLLRDRERPMTLFWGIAVDGEDYRRFETTESLMRFLESYQEKLLLYHHHDFDPIQALCDGARLHVDRVRKGRILRARGPGPHEWRNSYALFHTGLAEILEACGFKKLALADLDARNVSDTVEALAAFKTIAAGFEEAFGINPLGGKYLTEAGVAFAAACAVAGPLPQWLANRNAYRGGRVEAFKVCNCPGVMELGQDYCRCLSARSYDIASSYPYSFLDLPADRDELFYADVEVSHRLERAAPFFLLDERKLIFPRGRFRTAFWRSSYERYIAPHGAVKKIRPFERIRCDFSWLARCRDLITRAFGLKARSKKTNPPLAYACKRGLNSIYGRLALDTVREIVIQAPTIAAGDKVSWKRLPSGDILSFVEATTEPQANYLMASAITCNARARLYDAMARNPGVIYCDTDSVFIPTKESFNGNIGEGIGQWKLEKEGKLSPFGLKDYIFDGQEKLKGGKRSFQWSLKSAFKPDGSLGDVREIVRRRRGSYDKREVLHDGSTRPLTCFDW